MTTRIAIVDGVRTPFCKAGGKLRHCGADDLGAITVRELLARTGLAPDRVDELIFGNVCQPPNAPNLARVIALKAGLPQSTIAYTVQRNCASGIQAVSSAAQQIMTGESEIVIAGGAESMSQVPLLFGRQMTELFIKLMRARTATQKLRTAATFRPSFLKPVIGLELGLSDPVCELNMGQTAEILARQYSISRNEQDELALLSHSRASVARAEGRLADEITPLCPAPKYNHMLDADDGPRDGQTMDALEKLRPYFDRRAGTVTVGNSCPITDGAAALLVCSEEVARREGWQPLGFLDGWAYAALDPARMGLGPVFATAKLLDSTGKSLDDFDILEMNEAFAAQVIANERAFASESFAHDELGRSKPLGTIDREKLNVNGGAIALGHPVGATGARLILTTLKELHRSGRAHGLATLCVGGGQGAAVALEAA